MACFHCDGKIPDYSEESIIFISGRKITGRQPFRSRKGILSGPRAFDFPDENASIRSSIVTYLK